MSSERISLEKPASSPPKVDRAYDWPDPAAGTGLRRFVVGLQAAFSGFTFTLRHGRVLALSAAAVVLYLILWVLILWAAASWDQRFADALLWVRGPSWWESALWQGARALLYVVFWIVALLAAYVLALPLMAPLFTLLAEVVERAFYGDAVDLDTSWRDLTRELVASLVRSMALALVNVVGAAAIWGLGLVVGLIFPPLGTGLSLILGGGWAALWLGIVGMSYVLENNGTVFGEQLRLPGQNLPLLLGFGLVAQVLAWLPPTAPLVIVSATVLCCRLNRHGHIALPVRDAWQRQRSDREASPRSGPASA